MSHSLSVLHSGVLDAKLLTLTIINYATGGEAVAPSEIGGVDIDFVILGTVPAGQNSLGVPLFPVLSGGKVMLFRFVSGTPAEIPATTALNANISAIVHSSTVPA